MIKIKVTEREWESGVAEESTYENGQRAIYFMTEPDKQGFTEKLAVLTVCLPKDPPEGTVWVKTWSENTHMYLSLVDKGFLVPTTHVYPCGFVEAIACKLTQKFEDELEYTSDSML